MQYFGADGPGSLRQLFDASAEVVGNNRYDPYGNLMSQNGNATSVFGYTGEHWDAGTGLEYLRARYYSSSQGRFTTRDVWEGDPNVPMSYNAWNYAIGNPVNLLDPSGLQYCDPDFTLAECFRRHEQKVFRDNQVIDWKQMSDLMDAMYQDLMGWSPTPGVWSPRGYAPLPFKEWFECKSDIPSIGCLPGFLLARGSYDTPFFNQYREDTTVCFKGPGCFAQSDVNYVAQGMWGAASKVKSQLWGESKSTTFDVANMWKSQFGNFYSWFKSGFRSGRFPQTYDKPLSMNATLWLDYGYEYVESRYNREKSK